MWMSSLGMVSRERARCQLNTKPQIVIYTRKTPSQGLTYSLKRSVETKKGQIYVQNASGNMEMVNQGAYVYT